MVTIDIRGTGVRGKDDKKQTNNSSRCVIETDLSQFLTKNKYGKKMSGSVSFRAEIKNRDDARTHKN